MRRKDCEITSHVEILEIIKSCEVVRLGMVDEAGDCYIVPVNFAADMQEGRIRLYFHSAKTGKKVSLLRENPAVSFEVDTAHALETGEKCSDYTYHYLCVMGRGSASFVEDPAEKVRAMSCLMKRFTGRESWPISSQSLEQVQVLRLDIEEWSGKKH